MKDKSGTLLNLNWSTKASGTQAQYPVKIFCDYKGNITTRGFAEICQIPKRWT